MSWLTIAWTFAASACSVLALVHFMIWSMRMRERVHFWFALMALGAAGSGGVELGLLKSDSVESYACWLRWQHVPIFMLLVSMVWSVQAFFQTGRRGLAWTITSLWSLALVINFLSPYSLVYREITGLRHVVTFGGETFFLAEGIRNPWATLADLTSILILVYVVDASVRLWRRGHHRRAAVIGGSITFFMVAAGVHAPLVDAGIVNTPYMISFAFLAIVAAMNYELGSDVVRASVLSREVAANEHRWRSLMENVELVVIGIDPQGRVNFLNPFFERLTGFDTEQVIGQPINDLIVPAQRQALSDRLLEARRTGPRPHSEWSLLCASGGERRLAWSSVKLLDAEGNFSGVLSVGADITDRMRAQDQLQRTQRDLDRLSRANLLGELVSALAHELNQPLTAILSNAQAGRRMLVGGNADLTEMQAILDDIVRDDKRAGEVIHSLRGMLRGDAGAREKLDLNELAQGVVDLVQREFDGRGIAIRFDRADHALQIEASTVELQQVIMNLLMNAAHAMHRTASGQRQVVLSTASRDGFAAVTVRDTGCGIPNDSLPTIFEPFFTTKSAGLGMGLAICRRMLEKHGGRISARNNPDGGATFEFTLPFFQAPGAPASSPAQSPSARTRRRDASAPGQGDPQVRGRDTRLRSEGHADEPEP